MQSTYTIYRICSAFPALSVCVGIGGGVCTVTRFCDVKSAPHSAFDSMVLVTGGSPGLRRHVHRTDIFLYSRLGMKRRGGVELKVVFYFS